MFDRAIFFAAVRARPFAGRLKSFQVSGLQVLLDAAQRRGLTDLRQIAYVLATVHHETAATMQPIREIGRGRGKTYGAADPETGKTYFGRGYVQLTWKANYRRLGDRLGVDLVAEPDRALRPDIAAAVLFEGMTHGLFTGRRLSDFFSERRADWLGARRIVNGTDRAAAIADLAHAYFSAVTLASTSGAVRVAGPPARAREAPAQAGAFASRLWGALASLFTKRSNA